jgi:cobalt-zinc-cadmium efflux system membrane fusion protein
MIRRFLRLPALGAALFVLAATAGCGDQPVEKAGAPRDPMAIAVGPELATRLQTGQPFQVEVREVLRVPGRIETDETRLARIGAPVPGRITDLQAREGDTVRRGQVLAVLHSTELSTAQLAYLKALAQRSLAARAASRAQQLLEADVIGAAELQRRQAELAQAEAEVNAAGDQLKVLGMSAAALEKLAQSRTIHSVTQIVATIDGTIIDRKVTEGQVVQPADGVFLVADLTNLWLVADVPEQNAGGLRLGDAVRAEVAALPGRPITGTLAYIAPTVSPETRTVRVRMDLPNPEREFRPNMLASLLIKGAPHLRLTIPAEAVVREGNRDYVFVRTGENAYRLQPVQLGGEHEGRRVVVSGLREADVIVTSGAFHLNNERKRRELSGS